MQFGNAWRTCQNIERKRPWEGQAGGATERGPQTQENLDRAIEQRILLSKVASSEEKQENPAWNHKVWFHGLWTKLPQAQCGNKELLGMEGWMEKQEHWHSFWSQIVHVAKWRRACGWHTLPEITSFANWRGIKAQSLHKNVGCVSCTVSPELIRCLGLRRKKTWKNQDKLQTVLSWVTTSPCPCTLCQQLEREEFLEAMLSKHEKGGTWDLWKHAEIAF